MMLGWQEFQSLQIVGFALLLAGNHYTALHTLLSLYHTYTAAILLLSACCLRAVYHTQYALLIDNRHMRI